MSSLEALATSCGTLHKWKRKIAVRAERTKLTANRVLEELYFVATSRIDDYEIDALDETQPVKPKDGKAPEIMRAVASVKRTVGRDGKSRVELRLWPKDKALALAMKHLGLFEPDRMRVDLEGMPINIATLRAIAGIGAALSEAEASPATPASHERGTVTRAKRLQTHENENRLEVR